MAPKILSAFISLLSLSLTNLHSRVFTVRKSPPHPILRKSLPELAESESGGTGATSSTRGDNFLQRQQSIEAAKLVMKEKKPKDAKKMKREKLPKVSSAVASCYGCGAPLQTSEMDALGYIDPDT